MGCDIHVHVEVKHETLGWLHYNHPRVERSYALFYAMAGVRPSDDWKHDVIAQPRGLPDDANVTTRLDYEKWDGDAHTASWLERDDIKKLEKWLNEWTAKHDVRDRWCPLESRFGYLFGNSLAFNRDESYPSWMTDVRLVFWFDN